MPAIPTAPIQTDRQRRRVLLNLKGLFWCLHQMRQNYNLNLVVHSLERGYVHADIADSNMGDNIKFLLETFEPEDLERIQSALSRILESKASVDVGEKHFEIGHYMQADRSFGPIAEDSCGIICSVTPQLRGLFYLEGGRLMESAFAPSDVRVIFGTYIS